MQSRTSADQGRCAESAIAIIEVQFGHLDGSEIGSCAPVGTFEMICAGATIYGQ